MELTNYEKEKINIIENIDNETLELISKILKEPWKVFIKIQDIGKPKYVKYYSKKIEKSLFILKVNSENKVLLPYKETNFNDFGFQEGFVEIYPKKVNIHV